MAQSITVDLRLTETERTAIGDALTTLARWVETPDVQHVLGLWPELPDAVRSRIREKAPLFARLMALGERMSRL